MALTPYAPTDVVNISDIINNSIEQRPSGTTVTTEMWNNTIQTIRTAINNLCGRVVFTEEFATNLITELDAKFTLYPTITEMQAAVTKALTTDEIIRILKSTDDFLTINKTISDALDTALSSYYTKTTTDTLLGNKVDKVDGKGLSTNDYTTPEKDKLAGIGLNATPLLSTNKPTTTTAGLVGQHLLAILPTNEVIEYVCTDATNGVYTWKVVGGAVAKAMTLAQYTALSDTEKMNGTMYLITDDDASMTADDIPYNNATSGLVATKVRGAIDAIVANQKNGWNLFPTTFTYPMTYMDSSTNSDGSIMYTITLNTVTDMSANLELGYRFKYTINGIVTYGILVAKATSSITLLLKKGTAAPDNTKAITDIYYSPAKCPVGFSINPNDWTLKYESVQWTYVATPSVGYAYFGNHNLAVLTGLWNLSYSSQYGGHTSGGSIIGIGLSKVNNSIDDNEFASQMSLNGVSVEQTRMSKCVMTTSKTTYYLVMYNSSTNTTQIEHQYNYITAVCAYL